jgi:hypothetical protein
MNWHAAFTMAMSLTVVIGLMFLFVYALVWLEDRFSWDPRVSLAIIFLVMVGGGSALYGMMQP